MRKTLSLLLPLALAGCQTWGPAWSEISGARYYDVTTLNRAPTIIERIDGQGAFIYGTDRSVKVDPGKRQVTLQGVPLRPGWQGYLKEMTLEAEPCKRYYINAQYPDPLSPSAWTPVIAYVETIAGCATTVASK
jgi:hypothetical protein